MKTLFLFTFFFGLFTSLAAQTIRCPKEDCGRFQRFIQAAQDAADKPDFNQAIIQYNAARVCCPSAAEAIDAQILKIFELIENQRKMAAANADRAQKAEAKTKSALDKAERLVGFFGFTQNRAWAYKNGKFAVIDRNGTQWTDFVYENPDPFQPNGYALARKGGFYVLVDTLGRTSPEYDYLFPTNHGCYKVRKEKKYTFADFKGSPLPGASWYESIDTFCNGLATVNKKDQWGFIDSKGQEEIKAKFQSVSSFQGELAWAANDNGKWGIINKKGQFVTPQEFSNGAFLKPGISWARKPGKWGVVDKNGKFITPPQYDQIREFDNGFALRYPQRQTRLYQCPRRRSYSTEIRTDH
ncbi:MAG: WG repeat-containing protein [Lewinellaceae bacterium]|nr:WG repeat-containing protein [Lewinellaceae bacterium]